MNQESRNVAVQLAREVLLGDFRGHLDSYPLAEQLIAMDKMAVIQKPDDLAVWNEIGLFSQYLQRYDAARDAYLRISQVLPNDPGGFLGVAAADLAKADSENSALLNKRGLLPTSDIALKPEYTEVCGTLKQKTRNILDDGYTYAKRATQLRPEDDFSYWILSLLAQRKAWTDCGDTVAAEADGAEGVQLATLSGEKSKAAIGRRESHIRKVAVALGPPPHLAGPIGAIGGIVTQPAASMQVWGPVSVSVASGIQAGLLVSKVDPIYPQLARQARIQGSVILAAQIGKEGEIEDLQLISGHPMLVPAAIDAVKQWKYKPYVLNGTPVGVRTQIEVNFILSQQ
jgi:TonB family protein